jgi:hypothetical protein
VKNCKRRWITNVLIDENMKALRIEGFARALEAEWNKSGNP